MLVALAQLNPTVGDIEHNCKKAVEAIREARLRRASMVAFPAGEVFRNAKSYSIIVDKNATVI